MKPNHLSGYTLLDPISTKQLALSDSIAGIRGYKCWPTNYRRFVRQEFSLSIGNSKYRCANKVKTTHSHKTNSFIILCCLHFSLFVHTFLLFRSHREAAKIQCETDLSFRLSMLINILKNLCISTYGIVWFIYLMLFIFMFWNLPAISNGHKDGWFDDIKILICSLHGQPER